LDIVPGFVEDALIIPEVLCTNLVKDFLNENCTTAECYKVSKYKF